MKTWQWTTIEAKRGGECVGYDGFKHRKGTKVHVMVDEDSKPLAVVISPGNTHDSRMFDEVYGRLRDRPLRLYGDSAYDTDEIRLKLERDGVQANIPVNPRNGRRPIPYDERGYRVMKSAVERFNSWLKTFRRAVVRYERLAVMFQAIITFTCIMIHMRYGL
ncbi:MAG: transposase [Thermoprotei archaeon]